MHHGFVSFAHFEAGEPAFWLNPAHVMSVNGGEMSGDIGKSDEPRFPVVRITMFGGGIFYTRETLDAVIRKLRYGDGEME